MGEVDQGVVAKALDWAYESAINGLPGMGTAEELAADYRKEDGSVQDQANALIRWQIAKCATSGFLTGLGGIITLPVAIPANLSSVLYVQIRMIAAIAALGGHDVRSDQVKTMIYACLCGSSIVEVVRGAGIKVGMKITENVIKGISKEIIVNINKAVGFRLVTKFGTTGVVNLGKTIPLVGGLIGGTMDAISTNTIGNIARDVFVLGELSESYAN